MEICCSNRLVVSFSRTSIIFSSLWSSLQRASFVVWDNISTTFSCQSSSFNLIVRLQNAGLYLFNETATDFSVTNSHSTRFDGTMTITVNRVGFGKECKALSDSTTEMTIALLSTRQSQGSSVTVTCNKRHFLRQ